MGYLQRIFARPGSQVYRDHIHSCVNRGVWVCVLFKDQIFLCTMLNDSIDSGVCAPSWNT